MSNGSSTGGGIGVVGLLGVVFVTLKLTHYIDWPWWLVLAPFWSGALLLIAFLIVVFVIVLVAAVLDKR